MFAVPAVLTRAQSADAHGAAFPEQREATILSQEPYFTDGMCGMRPIPRLDPTVH